MLLADQGTRGARPHGSRSKEVDVRLRYSFLLGALLLAGSASAARASQTWIVPLSPATEVPPAATSSAAGTATVTLNDAQTILHVHLTFSGLTSAETQAHIHKGAPGTNGTVQVFITNGAAEPADLDWSIPSSSVADLLAGNLYVNVHTQAYPGGEIRGNIIGATNTFPASWGKIKGMYQDRC